MIGNEQSTIDPDLQPFVNDDSVFEEYDDWNGPTQEDTRMSTSDDNEDTRKTEPQDSAVGKSSYVTFQSIMEEANVTYRKVQHNAAKRQQLLELAETFRNGMRALLEEIQKKDIRALSSSVILNTANVVNTQPGVGNSTRLRRAAEYRRPATRQPKRRKQDASTNQLPHPTGSLIQDIAPPKTSGRPRKTTIEKEVNDALSALLTSKISDPASDLKQGSQQWLDYKLGRISGTTARSIRVNGKGLVFYITIYFCRYRYI